MSAQLVRESFGKMRRCATAYSIFMSVIEKSVLVRHSARRMYELVADVESYPDFLPWCGGARVVARDASGVTAEIDIRFKGLKQSFTTRNVETPFERIDVQLVKGPFSRLEGDWHFTPLAEDSCKVELRLAYKFDNFLLERLVGPVFHVIGSTMVDRFTRRADSIGTG